MDQDPIQTGTKNAALKLWLAGTPDADIAKKLGIERAEVESWRLSERWHELRPCLDLVKVLRTEAKDEAADEHADTLIEITENFVTKIMQRRIDSIAPDDLLKLVMAVKAGREVRESVRRSRAARNWKREEREKW